MRSGAVVFRAKGRVPSLVRRGRANVAFAGVQERAKSRKFLYWACTSVVRTWGGLIAEAAAIAAVELIAEGCFLRLESLVLYVVSREC